VTGNLAGPHTTAMLGQTLEKDKNVNMSMPIVSVDAKQESVSKL